MIVFPIKLFNFSELCWTLNQPWEFENYLKVSTVNPIEFQSDMFGLYELQEERLHKNHSVYKLKHTTEVEYTQLLYS